jgi:hypothetical protein
MENKTKIKTLGTEWCENIDTLYINKIISIAVVPFLYASILVQSVQRQKCRLSLP